MKVQLTDVRGKKVVFEFNAPAHIAKLLVRRDQTVEYEGIQYGFLSQAKDNKTGEVRTRYVPLLPAAQLTEDMRVQ